MLGRFFRKRVLVSQILDDYMADFALRGCRSRKSTRSEVGALKRYFGEAEASSLSTATLRQFQADRRGAGLAAASVNRQLSILSAALALAVASETIPDAPKFPRKLKGNTPRQGFFEVRDYEIVRAALPEWGQPVLDFAFYSGWRRNEILGLTPEEVDLDACQIRLSPARSKNGETRLLPLMDFGLEAIQRGLAAGAERVFTRGDRLPISGTYWHETWRRATKRAGRDGLLFHDLRRSVARRFELAGVPRKAAMAWIGHKTEAMYQRYAITTERDLAPAGEKMLRSIRPADELRVVPFRKKGT